MREEGVAVLLFLVRMTQGLYSSPCFRHSAHSVPLTAATFNPLPSEGSRIKRQPVRNYAICLPNARMSKSFLLGLSLRLCWANRERKQN